MPPKRKDDEEQQKVTRIAIVNPDSVRSFAKRSGPDKAGNGRPGAILNSHTSPGEQGRAGCFGKAGPGKTSPEFPAAPVGLAPFEVADHRVVLEGDGPAEGLDRGARVVPGQGGVAVGYGLPVGSLALALGVAIHPRGAQSEQKQPGQDPFHGLNGSRPRNTAAEYAEYAELAVRGVPRRSRGGGGNLSGRPDSK